MKKLTEKEILQIMLDLDSKLAYESTFYDLAKAIYKAIYEYEEVKKRE